MTFKNSLFLIISCIGLSFLTACHSHEQSPELLEAMEVHKQIIEVEKEVKQKFEESKTGLSDSLAIQQLDELQGKYKEWQSNLVEVPGMEHDHDHHDHDHDHDHDHGQELKITDALMLEVQKSLLQELKSIQATLQKL